MEVMIMVGASGSGKTTWIKNYCPQAQVVSADSYFLRNGEYEFDPAKLGKAHAFSLRSFIAHCVSGAKFIVVDNTNTTIEEIAPYMAIAQAYEADVIRVIWLGTDNVKELVRRNTHNVPERTIRRHIDNMARTKLSWPPYWPIPEVRYE